LSFRDKLLLLTSVVHNLMCFIVQDLLWLMAD